LVDPSASSGKQRKDDAPKHDLVITEGQMLTIGDFSITAFTVPGHTPGTVGYIFPVKEGKKTYKAGLFGGNVLVPRIAYNLDLYVDSLAKWQGIAKDYKVDVQLQNHPHMLAITDKLNKLQSRKDGDPNPFVIANGAYIKYFQVIQECTLAQKLRIIENPTPAAK